MTFVQPVTGFQVASVHSMAVSALIASTPIHSSLFSGVNPAFVILEQLAAPVAVVEGRIGQHVVGLEIRVPVVVEGVAVGDLRVDAANGEVHLG